MGMEVAVEKFRPLYFCPQLLGEITVDEMAHFLTEVLVFIFEGQINHRTTPCLAAFILLILPVRLHTGNDFGETLIPIDQRQADLLLTTTRALREDMDLERAVPRSVIEECVTIAIQAPAGTTLPTEHFLIVMDPDKRRLIADLYRKACYPFLERRRAQITGDDEVSVVQRQKLDSLRWQADIFDKIPALVLALKNGRVETTETLPQASFYGGILPIAWSFILALRARGLGACWMSLLIAQEKEAAQILGIPDNVTQTALFPIGYYKAHATAPPLRELCPEQLHWDTWGVHGD